MPSQQVEYREIPGMPGYRVGNDGSVWSRWRQSGFGPGKVKLPPVISTAWKLMKTWLDDSGHIRVTTRYSESQTGVHVLVLNAFVGPCPEGMECCHYDGVPSNNKLSNLRWDTPKANKADSARHGTIVKGADQHLAKLTNSKVREIRRLLKEKKTHKSIAAMFGVSRAAISFVSLGITWKHVK